MTIFQFAIARVAAQEAAAVLAGASFSRQRKARALRLFADIEGLNDGRADLGAIRLAAVKLRNGRHLTAGDREAK